MEYCDSTNVIYISHYFFLNFLYILEILFKSPFFNRLITAVNDCVFLVSPEWSVCAAKESRWQLDGASWEKSRELGGRRRCLQQPRDGAHIPVWWWKRRDDCDEIMSHENKQSCVVFSLTSGWCVSRPDCRLRWTFICASSTTVRVRRRTRRMWREERAVKRRTAACR